LKHNSLFFLGRKAFFYYNLFCAVLFFIATILHNVNYSFTYPKNPTILWGIARVGNLPALFLGVREKNNFYSAIAVSLEQAKVSIPLGGAVKLGLIFS